jgi:hypothetical protein
MNERISTTITENPEFSPCCSKNCGTNLCPKQFLLNKFLQNESFDGRMTVFKEIKADDNISPIDKPHVYKQTLNLLWQKAHTVGELQQVLDEFPTITHARINFEEIKAAIYNKMKSLEGASENGSR